MTTASVAPSPRYDAQHVSRLIDVHFPQVHADGRYLIVEDVRARAARVRMLCSQRNIRPGGTISGPAIFTLADFGIYVAILGELGAPGLKSVTTSLTLNFVSRPALADMLAEVSIVKLGRRLIVAEAELYSDGVEGMVAHAIGTYAMPPETVR